MKYLKICLATVTVVMLLFMQPMQVFADDGIDWPQGSYYNPYTSVKELPDTICRYDSSSADEQFNTSTYFRVSADDIACKKGSIIKTGESDQGDIWSIAVPVLHNAEMLDVYCRQNDIVLVMIQNVSDRKRVTLLGLDSNKLDSSKIMIGGQSAFSSDAVFEIVMSGEILPIFSNYDGLVSRAIRSESTKPTYAATWSVDNIGSTSPLDEEFYIYKNGIGSELQDVVNFTSTEITISMDMEDLAVECIESYIQTKGGELG